MTANDLKPGMEYDGRNIERVARRGATVTLTVEGGDTIELDRWESLEDTPDDPAGDDGSAGEPEDAGVGGTDIGWSSRTSDLDDDD